MPWIDNTWQQSQAPRVHDGTRTSLDLVSNGTNLTFSTPEEIPLQAAGCGVDKLTVIQYMWENCLKILSTLLLSLD
ncbi:hypothetical protein OA58_01260 [Microcystis aeruginosa NIES-88]|nr:hypothetical protein OA58_01260 [Microcystis aeruginosa NIES-88]BCU12339.1 hypothetical protein MAN88_29030 [Microcystis aeruginosa]